METRAKPIVTPALYAVLKAAAKLYLAQYVVLKLAFVATTIPILPQIIDIKAPTKNAIAVDNPYSVKKVIIMNMIATNTKHIQYYCFKNSYAPYINKQCTCEIFSPNSSNKFFC